MGKLQSAWKEGLRRNPSDFCPASACTCHENNVTSLASLQKSQNLLKCDNGNLLVQVVSVVEQPLTSCLPLDVAHKIGNKRTVGGVNFNSKETPPQGNGANVLSPRSVHSTLGREKKCVGSWPGNVEIRSIKFL